MSTSSLPSYYLAPHLSHLPHYSQEPREHEQRLALNDRVPRPLGTFVKQSKDTRLTLHAQDGGPIPAYGFNGTVEGTVDIAKTESVTAVEIKVEGRFQLKEIAEGGTVDRKLCLASALLWSKDHTSALCPSSLPFQLNLPTKFEVDGQLYTLPPTYNVKLSGVPGFVSFTEYSMTVTTSKNITPTLAPLAKANFLRINPGATTLSTPFVYYPRTRPAMPLPPPLRLSSRQGFDLTPEWQLHESTIPSRRPSLQDIKVYLYIPSSRIFCFTQGIPFHLTFESSAMSLASFLPLGPSGNSATKTYTRLQILRKISVDVRKRLIVGTKSDMWRIDCLGEATFRHTGDGPSWVSFTGQINVDPSTKTMGFKFGGISVKDFILFSMTPPETQKAPFSELRHVVPIRLTTDPWSTGDGTGIGLRCDSQLSVASSPDSSAE